MARPRKSLDESPGVSPELVAAFRLAYLTGDLTVAVEDFLDRRSGPFGDSRYGKIQQRSERKPMNRVAFIDCETLGLDADVHPVWEVAVILPDGFEWECQVRVTERDISLAHPVALEISGFNERYAKTNVPDLPEDVAHYLHELIPERCHLAGMVVSFDEERLRRMMWEHGYSPPWHYHLVDVETLVVGWLAASRSEPVAEDVRGWVPDKCVPPWKSEELSLAVGVDPEQFARHTAMGDARWAKAIYEAVMWGADPS